MIDVSVLSLSSVDVEIFYFLFFTYHSIFSLTLPILVISRIPKFYAVGEYLATQKSILDVPTLNLSTNAKTMTMTMPAYQQLATRIEKDTNALLLVQISEQQQKILVINTSTESRRHTECKISVMNNQLEALCVIRSHSQLSSRRKEPTSIAAALSAATFWTSSSAWSYRIPSMEPNNSGDSIRDRSLHQWCGEESLHDLLSACVLNGDWVIIDCTRLALMKMDSLVLQILLEWIIKLQYRNITRNLEFSRYSNSDGKYVFVNNQIVPCHRDFNLVLLVEHMSSLEIFLSKSQLSQIPLVRMVKLHKDSVSILLSCCSSM